ncbi:MAG: aminotransferase class I/II-fold pyridoxal phosphate-dependent enzyme [Candidatus Eisenbacteria bacterium]|uniref:Aminotransferase class I/II-fold pyridoxal phosphate-dependent enzyme n=1 Tax=Eiseniibacteriota bacterium TaxID=2212470 RepID=A0A9D6QK50_UNCEI|nr:aminotransferase class I/II-fold pyridoxal phosphate-dependent enzyme [Candidatus Eisenbacteria bacterium]MBI3539841.1 aminotransferase class I/II-fold pyridoxal phosphate-dependent enzyme [Candidatus Eisenbacteria bacterium]
MAVRTRVQSQMHGDSSDYDYSSFYYSSSDDVFAILEPYTEWYDDAQLRGYYLYGQPMSSRPTTRIELQEKLEQRRLNLLNLSSYNYLGLSYRPEVIEAAKRALDRYGMGAAGSPVLSGTMDVHIELERELAAFKNKPACMLFPTGYSTNVGLIQGLMRPGDLIVADQNSHASIVDGAILSKAEVRFFRHNRPEELEKKLKGWDGKKMVVVEGVYSMDGDVCKLPEIVAIAKKHEARIMIDEAHSTFIYGENGRGVAEAFGLEDEIDIHVGTLSKALGGQGGFVAGSASLYKYLEGFARSRLFSCALSPVVSGGVLEALRIAGREPGLRARLWANVAHIRRLMREEGIDVGESTSQVIPVMIRNDRRIFDVAHRLQRAGLYLQPIVYPAVAKHRSRFRISVSATHTTDQLNEGVSILAHVLREEGIL